MDNAAAISVDDRHVNGYRFFKYLLLGPLLVLILAVCALTLVYLNSLEKNELITVMRQYNDVARINFEFKLQVQEWKNFLLRGQKNENLDQLWVKFESQETKVAEISQAAIDSMTNPILLRDIRRFSQAHIELGKKYRQARDVYNADLDLKSADFLVRGVDRQPAAMLNNAIEHARTHVYQERRRLEKYSTFIFVSAIVLLLTLAVWLIIITYVGTLRTLQDAKAVRQRMERIANTDSLTGIHNRRYFEEHLNQLLIERSETKTPFDIFYFDLNGFKEVNDNFGHDVGDELLRIVADRLQSFFDEDGMVARHGGDEFLALSRSVAPIPTEEVIKQMHEQLTQPIVLAGHDHHVGCSIGHGRFPDDGTNPHSLIRTADHTMYSAKQLSKGVGIVLEGDQGAQEALVPS